MLKILRMFEVLIKLGLCIQVLGSKYMFIICRIDIHRNSKMHFLRNNFSCQQKITTFLLIAIIVAYQKGSCALPS